ncbi:DUF1871 family protein [Gottfriedia acidiceleris]|uniref:DUF1871 family protein n=1 Tax=Bacillaceae TaxID=186817 RepID=UPI0015965CF0|nr:DUF1871 family protein [Bacillus sp. AFS001701]
MGKFYFVKEIIDEWAPIGLLGLGCPDDEYAPEIRDIVELLNDMNTVEELAVGINEVFIKWFGEDLTIQKCYPAALKIWNKIS